MSEDKSKGKRILAVEDDPGYRELMTAVLSKDFDLTLCESVEEALPLIDAGGYHLIVADINFFGMTGFEILSRMRQSAPLKRAPVLFCSGLFDEDTKIKALAEGAAGFIAKPFQPEALLTTVRSLLS